MPNRTKRIDQLFKILRRKSSPSEEKEKKNEFIDRVFVLSGISIYAPAAPPKMHFYAFVCNVCADKIHKILEQKILCERVRAFPMHMIHVHC